MTTASKITLIRVVMIPAFMVALLLSPTSKKAERITESHSP